MGNKNHGYSKEVQSVVYLGTKKETINLYFRVYSLAFRVPKRGEIYYSPVTETLRMMKEINYSNRAKKRHIIWSPYKNASNSQEN